MLLLWDETCLKSGGRLQFPVVGTEDRAEVRRGVMMRPTIKYFNLKVSSPLISLGNKSRETCGRNRLKLDHCTASPEKRFDNTSSHR